MYQIVKTEKLFNVHFCSVKPQLVQQRQIYCITIFASVFLRTDLQTVDKHFECTG